jgi:hypothetical protein
MVAWKHASLAVELAVGCIQAFNRIRRMGTSILDFKIHIYPAMVYSSKWTPRFQRRSFILSLRRCAMLKDADPSYFSGICIVCGYTDLLYGMDSLAAIIERKYQINLFVPN